MKQLSDQCLQLENCYFFASKQKYVPDKITPIFLYVGERINLFYAKALGKICLYSYLFDRIFLASHLGNLGYCLDVVV